MMKIFDKNSKLITSWTGRANMPFYAGLYVLAFLFVEFMVDDPIKHYSFCVFLSLSGICFSWFIGGRRTMFYVAFFNIFFVVIFSKLLWNQGMIVYSGLFLSRSFLFIYFSAAILICLTIFIKSPADVRLEKQAKTIEDARQHRDNLEYMVASQKLKHDLLAQANMVKDELQLIEGAWQSKIHDIVNDLPEVKERELYQKIILPFQENIIRHLRELESGLTFDLKQVPLPLVFEFLADMAGNNNRMGAYGVYVQDRDWQKSSASVVVDKNKLWDMILNVLRNSQAALDLRKIDMLRSGKMGDFQSRISIVSSIESSVAKLRITDNGGGALPEHVSMLYQEPVPSQKRGWKVSGRGTLFVKFFAERMGIAVRAENTRDLGDNGLTVTLEIPLAERLNNQAES